MRSRHIEQIFAPSATQHKTLRAVKEGELPTGFDINKYSGTKDFGLANWAAALDSRYETIRQYFILVESSKDEGVTSNEMQDLWEIWKAAFLMTFNDPLDLGRFGDLSSIINEQLELDLKCSKDMPLRTKHSLELESAYSAKVIESENDDFQAFTIRPLTISDITTINEQINEAHEHPPTGVNLSPGSALAFDRLDEMLRHKLDIDPHSTAHIVVNTAAPENDLVKDFESWLHEYRRMAAIETCLPIITKAKMASWSRDRLLAFLDLSMWAWIQSAYFTPVVMGQALFPPTNLDLMKEQTDSDLTAVRRNAARDCVRQRNYREALRMMKPEMFFALKAQAEVELAGRKRKYTSK